MRTIKFRVWSRLRSNWVNPVLDITNNFYHEDNENRVFEQFTGLQDKNGVDIYEGDKLIDKDNREYEVVYEYNLFCIKHSFFGTTAIKHNTHLRFEIIGNIHES